MYKWIDENDVVAYHLRRQIGYEYEDKIIALRRLDAWSWQVMLAWGYPPAPPCYAVRIGTCRFGKLSDALAEGNALSPLLQTATAIEGFSVILMTKAENVARIMVAKDAWAKVHTMLTHRGLWSPSSHWGWRYDVPCLLGHIVTDTTGYLKPTEGRYFLARQWDDERIAIEIALDSNMHDHIGIAACVAWYTNRANKMNPNRPFFLATDTGPREFLNEHALVPKVLALAEDVSLLDRRPVISWAAADPKWESLV
jgi:hypothetical protein